MKQLSKVCSGTVYGAVLMALMISLLIACFHQGILHLLFGHAEPLVLANAQLYLLGLLASYPMQAVIRRNQWKFAGNWPYQSVFKALITHEFRFILLVMLYSSAFLKWE